MPQTGVGTRQVVETVAADQLTHDHAARVHPAKAAHPGEVLPPLETRPRRAHIDAPVGKVFAYVKEPQRYLEAFPEEERRHMALAEVNLTLRQGLGRPTG